MQVVLCNGWHYYEYTGAPNIFFIFTVSTILEQCNGSVIFKEWHVVHWPIIIAETSSIICKTHEIKFYDFLLKNYFFFKMPLLFVNDIALHFMFWTSIWKIVQRALYSRALKCNKTQKLYSHDWTDIFKRL